MVWHAQGSTGAAFGGRPPPAAAGGLALGSTSGRQRPCATAARKFRRCLGSNPCLPTSAARSRVRSVLDTQAMAGAREAGCIEPRSGPAAAFPLDTCVAASPSRGCKVSAAPRQQSVCAHAARCRVRCVLDTQPMAWQLPQIGGCVEPRRGLAWPSRAEQLPPLAASATVGQGQDDICADSMQMHSFRRSCRWYACGVRDPAAPPGVGAIAGVASGLHVPKASGSLVQCWHSRPAAGPQVGEHTLLPSSCYGKEVVPQAPGCPREHVVHGQTCTAAADRSPGHPACDVSRKHTPFPFCSSRQLPVHMHESQRCVSLRRLPLCMQAHRLPRDLRYRLEQARMRQMCGAQHSANVHVRKPESSPGSSIAAAAVGERSLLSHWQEGIMTQPSAHDRRPAPSCTSRTGPGEAASGMLAHALHPQRHDSGLADSCPWPLLMIGLGLCKRCRGSRRNAASCRQHLRLMLAMSTPGTCAG